MSDVDVRGHVLGQYENYYKNGASEWRRLGALDKVDNILALCGQLPRKLILEIGAGDGSILSRLCELGFAGELYAVEISSSGVEVIKSRRIPTLVECRLFDGYRLPYEGGRFDIAILSHVVEHVEHPRQLLYEAARVARYVLIEVPLEDMSRRAKDYSPDRVGHINFFSQRTIRWLVQSCGLRVVRQITTNPSKGTYVYQAGRRGLIQYYVKRILLQWAPSLATTHFCYHETLLATKLMDG